MVTCSTLGAMSVLLLLLTRTTAASFLVVPRAPQRIPTQFNPTQPSPPPPIHPPSRRVFQTVFVFMNTEVSSFYLDVAKDRLYIRNAADPSRRACQTVISELLSGLLAAIAPLVPHMAEDAWLALPHKPDHASVFQAGWAQPQPQWSQLPQVSFRAPAAHWDPCLLIWAWCRLQLTMSTTSVPCQTCSQKHHVPHLPAGGGAAVAGCAGGA
jgi:hypothetical protein